MKIAVLGASGWIGSHIAQEAQSRGHDVVAVVRDASKVETKGVEVRSFDLQDEVANLASALSGVDAVITSIGGRALGNHDIVKTLRLNCWKHYRASVSSAYFGLAVQAH